MLKDLLGVARPTD